MHDLNQMRPVQSDVLIQKQKDLFLAEQNLKEVKKGVDHIYRVFKTDANYPLMVETENDMKADRISL